MISDIFPWRQQQGQILKSKWLHVRHGCYGQGCHQPFLRTEKINTFLNNYNTMYFNIFIIKSISAIPISDFGLSSYCNRCWVEIQFQSAILKNHTPEGDFYEPLKPSALSLVSSMVNALLSLLPWPGLYMIFLMSS